MKPYSQACENNKLPILNEISSIFSQCNDVLEIGSGTGQHAIFFAEKLPHLNWHTSDCLENHSGIIEWIVDSSVINVKHPISLNVVSDIWPSTKFSAVFTANTCHIMHWYEVVKMFENVAHILSPCGFFVIYGPFNYQNAYTSESNKNFDEMLRTRDPESGIRDIEMILSLATDNSLELVDDIGMPANNRLLVFVNEN